MNREEIYPIVRIQPQSKEKLQKIAKTLNRPMTRILGDLIDTYWEIIPEVQEVENAVRKAIADTMRHKITEAMKEKLQ